MRNRQLPLQRGVTVAIGALGCTVLLAGGTAGARPAAAAGAPVARVAAAGGGTVLPQIPDGPVAEGKCTKESARTIAQTPWSQKALGLSEVRPLSQGSGVTVGVVDTGLDAGVAALKGRASGGGGKDCAGHGTFVAGIVAGAAQDGVGFAGVAPRARVLGESVSGADAGALAGGIEDAVAGGARIVLVSASATASDARLQAAVDKAAAKDVLVIAGATAGSKGAQAYPGGLPGVLSVAAVGVDGKPYPGRTGGQSTGASLPRVDLTAPGDRVVSVGPGGGHFTGGGDSVAAAFVAGTAALVRAHDPGLSAAQVADRLRATAARGPGAVPDARLGYGLVDPPGAVGAVSAAAGTGARTRTEGDPASAGTYRVPDRPRTTSPAVAWAVVGGAALVSLLVGGAALVIPRGRARGWRPGRLG
ncbi:S8 family serine peptidase [Streptomyces sp. x-80]|uniref:S8 family serine peptidase n=1 Tax=Streptomyces sp. x-80 TaxID=2789282 RepID=UPI003980EB4A